MICLLLASLNSCCNPWIYLAFSRHQMQLLPCFRKHHRKRQTRNQPTPLMERQTFSNNEGDRTWPLPRRILQQPEYSSCRSNGESQTSMTTLTNGNVQSKLPNRSDDHEEETDVFIDLSLARRNERINRSQPSLANDMV